MKNLKQVAILTGCLLIIISLLVSPVALAKSQAQPWLSQYTYPAPVKYFNTTIQNHSGNIAYILIKPPKWNGRTVLLFHGKNFFSAYWIDTIKTLNKNGYQVLAVDQIGFGKSSKPTDIYYTFQLLSYLTHSLLEKLHIPQVDLIGHSMGGMLAIRFSLMYPNMVSKLILEDPLGLEDYRLFVPFATVDQIYDGIIKNTPAGIMNYQKGYFHQWNDRYLIWGKLQAETLTAGDRKQLAWISALTYEMIYTQPVVYELKYLSMPTLLIVGESDRTAPGKARATPENQKLLGNFPKLGKAAVSQIPNGKLLVIPNVGHIAHLENFPEFISAVLAFLSANNSTSLP
jgi:pimeloyl-ACP methyl ester carboxylesterase